MSDGEEIKSDENNAEEITYPLKVIYCPGKFSIIIYLRFQLYKTHFKLL